MIALITTMAIYTFGSSNFFEDKFTANLTGAAEVPGPGDSDGAGTAMISINPTSGDVCFEIMASNIEPATNAHIHEGEAGKAGGVVLSLVAPAADGKAKDCVKNVDKELIKRITANPANFYVNVHTADFPDGAIRGQLSKGS